MTDTSTPEAEADADTADAEAEADTAEAEVDAEAEAADTAQATDATSSVAAAIAVVHDLLDAERCHDLARYRRLLADDLIERLGDRVIAIGADDAAVAAARTWVAAPAARRVVREVRGGPKGVRVRFTWHDASPPLAARGRGARPELREAPGRYVGSTVFVVRDGRVARITQRLQRR